jgi:hypothetical protein
MHPELDNLVKAFEALQVASPEDAPRLQSVYESLLSDVAASRRLDRALLKSRRSKATQGMGKKPKSPIPCDAPECLTFHEAQVEFVNRTRVFGWQAWKGSPPEKDARKVPEPV